jgi:nucleotide-binding universal stress UspA family protein
MTAMNAPVVVAVDGTPDGRRALRFAVDLAAGCGSPLRLVHVRHDSVMLIPSTPLLPEAVLDEIGSRVLDEALADAGAMGWRGPAPETVLERAPRVSAIVSHSGDARCVVLGRRSSPVQHLAGSTTNGVAAHSLAPVVCVPASWGPDVRFRRISVGVDCTEQSEALVEEAATWAASLQADVVVMHAWRPFAQYDAAISGRAFEERWKAETRPFVDRLVAPARSKHPDVHIDVELRYERPVVALHELSQVSDLLVVGRHGRHLRLTPRLGTTARTVLRSTECPALVVHVPHGDRP